jgi:single-strand DNA-binding protein
LVAFGRQAETIKQYLHKGSSLFVEGRIQTRSWDAQDGTKKYRTEIIVESFQFGPKTGGFTGGAPASQAGKAPELSGDDTLETVEYPNEEINLEDIPF